MAAVSIENSQHYAWGADCDGWHLCKTQGLSVIQERVPSGAEEICHSHVYAEQCFYVLSGTATLEVDGETVILMPNHSLHVARGLRINSRIMMLTT